MWVAEKLGSVSRQQIWNRALISQGSAEPSAVAYPDEAILAFFFFLIKRFLAGIKQTLT